MTTLHKHKIKKPLLTEGLVLSICGNGYMTLVYKDKNRYYLESDGIRMEEYQSELGKLLYEFLCKKDVSLYITSSGVCLEAILDNITIRMYGYGITYGSQLRYILYHINTLLAAYFNKKGNHRKHKAHGEMCKNCKYCDKVLSNGRLIGYRCKQDSMGVHPFEKCSDYEKGKSWYTEAK